jgi:signal transduction histidine kinase
MRLDEVVRQKFRLYRIRPALMKSNGFDFEYILNIGDPITSYREITEEEKPRLDGTIMELMDNAYKAIYGTPEPHRSDNIKELKKIRGKLEIGLSEEKDYYLISVRDDGCGIPEENFEAIFQRGFSTMDTGGIGLTIIQKYVDELGGAVRFESEVGKGTTFYIEIPKD